MSPEETKEFVAALQGKNYIMFKFNLKMKGIHPTELIEERSEWMTWKERHENPCYIRAIRDKEAGWRMYKRKDAKNFGYI